MFAQKEIDEKRIRDVPRCMSYLFPGDRKVGRFYRPRGRNNGHFPFGKDAWTSVRLTSSQLPVSYVPSLAHTVFGSRLFLSRLSDFGRTFTAVDNGVSVHQNSGVVVVPDENSQLRGTVTRKRGGGGVFRFNLIASRPQSKACARVQNDNCSAARVPVIAARRTDHSNRRQTPEHMRLQFSPHKPHVCFTAHNLTDRPSRSRLRSVPFRARKSVVSASVFARKTQSEFLTIVSRAVPSRMDSLGRTCIQETHQGSTVHCTIKDRLRNLIAEYTRLRKYVPYELRFSTEFCGDKAIWRAIAKREGMTLRARESLRKHQSFCQMSNGTRLLLEYTAGNGSNVTQSVIGYRFQIIIY